MRENALLRSHSISLSMPCVPDQRKLTQAVGEDLLHRCTEDIATISGLDKRRRFKLTY